MNRVRLGECERNFFEKIKDKGPKIHYFALKLYTRVSKLHSWASKSGGRKGGQNRRLFFKCKSLP